MTMGQSWSKMRKQLEQDHICDALKGRIQYFVTRYRNSHDQEGRVAIRLDGQEIFKSCYFDWCETRKQVIADLPAIKKTSDTYWEYWDKVYLETENRGGFDQFAFYDAFYYYQNHSIDVCFAAESSIVRLFAILDKRTGRRRLQKLLSEIENQPDWLKFFYGLRMDVEGIDVRVV